MATTPTTPTLIPVRLNLLVQVDVDQWTGTTPEVPATTVDMDAVVKGLIAAGIPEDQAKATAADLAAPKASAHGPSAVRTEVREYMLAAVRGLERLTATGAVVVDADREKLADVLAAAKAAAPAAPKADAKK